MFLNFNFSELCEYDISFYIELKNVNFKGILIMLKLKDSVENQPALNLME